MWTDKNGAKVGVYGPNTKDLYTQTTDPHDEATFTQQGSCSGHFRNFTAILSKLHDQNRLRSRCLRPRCFTDL